MRPDGLIRRLQQNETGSNARHFLTTQWVLITITENELQQAGHSLLPPLPTHSPFRAPTRSASEGRLLIAFHPFISSTDRVSTTAMLASFDQKMCSLRKNHQKIETSVIVPRWQWWLRHQRFKNLCSSEKTQKLRQRFAIRAFQFGASRLKIAKSISSPTKIKQLRLRLSSECRVYPRHMIE